VAYWDGDKWVLTDLDKRELVREGWTPCKTCGNVFWFPRNGSRCTECTSN
jgi:hypothetical protein